MILFQRGKTEALRQSFQYEIENGYKNFVILGKIFGIINIIHQGLLQGCNITISNSQRMPWDNISIQIIFDEFS